MTDKNRLKSIKNFILAIREMGVDLETECKLIQLGVDFRFLGDNKVISDRSYGRASLYEYEEQCDFKEYITERILNFDANKLNLIPFHKDIFDGEMIYLSEKERKGDSGSIMKIINKRIRKNTDYKFFKYKGELYKVSKKGALLLKSFENKMSEVDYMMRDINSLMGY